MMLSRIRQVGEYAAVELKRGAHYYEMPAITPQLTHSLQWAAIEAIAAKIGCSANTLCEWDTSRAWQWTAVRADDCRPRLAQGGGERESRVQAG